MNTAKNLNIEDVESGKSNNTQCEVSDCDVPKLEKISDICYKSGEIIEWCLLNPLKDRVYKFSNFKPNNLLLKDNNSIYIAGSYPLRVLLDYLHENYFDILSSAPESCPLSKKSPFDFKWKSNDIDLFVLGSKSVSRNKIGDNLDVVTAIETTVEQLLLGFDLPVCRVGLSIDNTLYVSIQAMFSILKRKMNLPLFFKTQKDAFNIIYQHTKDIYSNSLINYLANRLQERIKKYSGRGFGTNWIKTQESTLWLENRSIYYSTGSLYAIKETKEKVYPFICSGKLSQEGNYWNSNMSLTDFNKLIEKIYVMLEFVSKYDGKVFGGFVRNVVIPNQLNLPVSGFKDVDLWFKSQEDANMFIRQMDKNFVQANNSKVYDERYPFSRKEFLLIIDELKLRVPIDVIISEELPVNDFNVNQLTYNFVAFISHGKETVEQLKNHIQNKTMIMLPNYLQSQKTQEQKSYAEARIKKYIERGWKILNYVSYKSSTEPDKMDSFNERYPSLTIEKKYKNIVSGKIYSKSGYWNSNMDIDKFDNLLGNIKNMLSIANLYDGSVFGGFVRNVIVRNHLKMPLYGFKDIDIWFKTDENAQTFIESMGNNFKLNNNVFGDLYSFKRKQFFLLHPGLEPGVLVDVVISDELPVNDFNVNQLVFNSKHGFVSYGKDSVEELMICIYSKKMTMLPNYISNQKTTLQKSVMKQRLRNFYEKGWTITNFTQDEIKKL